MRFRTAVLLGCVCVATVTPRAAAQEGVLTDQEVHQRLQRVGDDPVEILKVSALANEPLASTLRKKVHGLLQQRRKELTSADLSKLGKRLARLLPTIVRTQKQVEEILGTPRTISRQILYRRYLLQLRFHQPVRLVVTLDVHQGGEPRIHSVQPIVSKS